MASAWERDQDKKCPVCGYIHSRTGDYCSAYCEKIGAEKCAYCTDCGILFYARNKNHKRCSLCANKRSRERVLKNMEKRQQKIELAKNLLKEKQQQLQTVLTQRIQKRTALLISQKKKSKKIIKSAFMQAKEENRKKLVTYTPHYQYGVHYW